MNYCFKSIYKAFKENNDYRNKYFVKNKINPKNKNQKDKCKTKIEIEEHIQEDKKSRNQHSTRKIFIGKDQ